LEKPSPTLSATMPEMIPALVGSPVSAETTAAARSKSSSGLRSCRPRIVHAVIRCWWMTLAPTAASRKLASVAEMPCSPLSSRASTSAAGRRPASARSSRDAPARVSAAVGTAPDATRADDTHPGRRGFPALNSGVAPDASGTGRGQPGRMFFVSASTP
jgi:hypothetical protein